MTGRAPSPLTPVALIAAGVLCVTAGAVTGGPDAVGGAVFGATALAAAGAILHRRSRDQRATNPAPRDAPPRAEE